MEADYGGGFIDGGGFLRRTCQAVLVVGTECGGEGVIEGLYEERCV